MSAGGPKRPISEEMRQHFRETGRIGGRMSTNSPLDDQWIHDYCLLLRAGVPKIRAAKQMKVAPDTVRKWISKGEKHIKEGFDNTVYARLAKAVPEAEDALGSKALNRIVRDLDDEKSPTSVSTAWKVVERVYPEEWGPPKQRTEHTTTISVVKYEALSTAELFQRLQAEQQKSSDLPSGLSLGPGEDDGVIEAEWDEGSNGDGT